MAIRIETGVHTYALYQNLSYTEAQNLIESFKECGHFHPIKEDSWGYNGVYQSNLYANEGVKISVYRYYNHSGFLLRITPCTLLREEYAAEELYQPALTNVYELTNRLSEILDNLRAMSGSENQMWDDEIKICRADPCANIYLSSENEVQEYLRILKKSALISHYRVEKFRKASSRVTDIAEANKHSYRIKGRRAEFTAYDKIYELSQSGRCPDELAEQHILRIEAGINREQLLKRLKLDKDARNEIVLASTAKRAPQILAKFLKRMKLGTGDYVRYRDAEDIIKKSPLEAKIKERMLYLIRKESDSNSLTAAIEKLCNKYSLHEQQCELVLIKFDELGISPITLRNDSQFDCKYRPVSPSCTEF